MQNPAKSPIFWDNCRTVWATLDDIETMIRDNDSLLTLSDMFKQDMMNILIGKLTTLPGVEYIIREKAYASLIGELLPESKMYIWSRVYDYRIEQLDKAAVQIIAATVSHNIEKGKHLYALIVPYCYSEMEFVQSVSPQHQGRLREAISILRRNTNKQIAY